MLLIMAEKREKLLINSQRARPGALWSLITALKVPERNQNDFVT